MTLELAFFNVPAVLVCFALSMIIGALWYSVVRFEDRSPRLALLNTGYSFLSLNIGTVTLRIWR